MQRKKFESGSTTAEGVLLGRFIATYYEENPALKLNDDYSKFLIKEESAADVTGKVQETIEKYRDRGGYQFIIARTKYFDDAFKKAIKEEPIKQIVILGAGYDSRFYRFRNELIELNIKCFEVDFPTTQELKKQRIIQHENQLPNFINYVPIDFNTQSLKDVLFEAGFQKELKTLFLWEGVSYYLNNNAVDSVLEFVHSNSPSESKIIFDYLYSELLDETKSYFGSQKFAKAVADLDEPLTFGIPEGTQPLTRFLRERGFALKDIKSPKELLQLIPNEKNIIGCIAIAQASVI